MANLKTILASVGFLLLSLQGYTQGVETKSIQEKNEFFKKLQSSVNLRSSIKTQELLTIARENYPEALLTWYISAQQAITSKEYMSAYEYYLQAKEISQDTDLDYLAIEIFKNLGEYDQLLSTYVSLLEAHPYDSESRSEYLNVLFQMQKYDEYASAVDNMIRIPMIRSAFKTSHFNRVSQLVKKGKISNFTKQQWEELRQFL